MAEDLDGAARWREGFHAPRGVAASAVWEAMQASGKYSPEEVFDASKDPGHVLHATLWSEGDQVWASRGRLEFTRKIISSLVVAHSVRNRIIEVRAVEFVRESWVPTRQIINDADLERAYQEDILRQAEQLHAKLARYFELKRHG